MGSLRKLLMIMWDIWRAKRDGVDGIQTRQQNRLRDMIEYVRQNSPYYKQLYQHLPAHIEHLSDLPAVTKHDLMSHFNDWVTDSRVQRADIEAYIADLSLIGVPYLGRYTIWRTSGTTGSPGIFLHDPRALAVYISLTLLRGYFTWMTLKQFLKAERRGLPTAFVFATGGHFAGNVFEAATRSLGLGKRSANRIISANLPLPDIVKRLNNNQPAIFCSYPSVLAQLAKEQLAGKLAIHPVVIVAGGECLTQPVREQIVAAFKCSVHDGYAASEFHGIAFECQCGRLHVNSDWVILEPVDANYQPVSPGIPSHTVLLTNLVNRVQPFIRYEIGDSITFYPDACPCGSPLPSIRVEGRDDEILVFKTPAGKPVELMPLPLETVVEVVPGIERFQLIQTTPMTLQIRLEANPEADDAQVWRLVEERLRAYLDSQGLSSVTIKQANEPPQSSVVSAKFRHVWSEWHAYQLPNEVLA
jgi:phenylacetate-coenzyme A ligase PaaK-like adenylate-forming protein